MNERESELLPGSQSCVGCGGMTFRQRADVLCPSCAFNAEALIERIELDSLSSDLQLITEFEAYYQQRERHRKRFMQAQHSVFPQCTEISRSRTEQPFRPDPFWTELREAS